MAQAHGGNIVKGGDYKMQDKRKVRPANQSARTDVKDPIRIPQKEWERGCLAWGWMMVAVMAYITLCEIGVLP